MNAGHASTRSRKISSKERQRLQGIWVNADHSEQVDTVNQLLKTPIVREASGEDLLRRPEVTYQQLTNIELFAPAHEDSQA